MVSLKILLLNGILCFASLAVYNTYISPVYVEPVLDNVVATSIPWYLDVVPGVSDLFGNAISGFIGYIFAFLIVILFYLIYYRNKRRNTQ